MELKAPLEKVKSALEVSRFTASGSGAPALTGVHVNVSNGIAEFTGFDGESRARTNLAVSSSTDGAGVLPRPAVEYLNALPPGGEVSVSFSSSEVRIACGSLSAKMRTDDPANYPKVPFAETDGVEIASSDLRKAIREVRNAAASPTAGRPAMAGMHFDVVDGELRLVTTDGYRLAIARLANSPLPDGTNLTVPLRAVNELERALAKSNKVIVRVEEQHVCFEVEHMKLASTLIAVKYPPYASIVPSSNAPSSVRASSNAILESIKRLKIVAPRENRSVKVNCTDGVVSISTTSISGDTATEPIVATVAGDVPDFAVNVDYLAEAVQALDGTEVVIAVHDPLKPLLMTRPGDESTKQVMMPIRA